MGKTADYRKRCYDAYIKTQLQYTHSVSHAGSRSSDQMRKEFDFFCRVAAKRYKNILPANRECRLIDIACGTGHFLYFLNKLGYVNAKGIDESDEILTAAKSMGIPNLEKADLFAYLPAHRDSFDFIAANDIIEHLTKNEVLEFLDLIRGSLAQDGALLISTLNAQSPFGARTVYVDFTHEQGFTPTSLAQVLRIAGFRDVRIYPEKPEILDLQSLIRAFLWRLAEQFLRMFIAVEYGTGRGYWKKNHVFTPRMFAVCRKQ